MSLTPGFILADPDVSGHIGVTLAEIAAIVGEWDRASGLTHDKRRRSADDFVVKGENPSLRIGWDRYANRPAMDVRRGLSGDSVYVYEADIAEMRRVLAGQGAA